MTSTSKICVLEIADDLTTRAVGAEARRVLIYALQKFEEIEVDFCEKSLTPSFADECIGQLAARLGLNEFKRRVKMCNLNESAKPLLKHVILTRCSTINA